MSDFNEPGDVFLADCPARLAIDVIGDRWSIVVLYALSRGPRRHGELVALIGGISKKVLTQTLRRLERHGLVHRDTGGAPARPSYRLTELGATLLEPIADLTRWAEKHCWAVLDALERSEAALAI